MSQLEFTHAGTKAAFEALPGVKDRTVYQPATKDFGEFSGKLSNIPPAVADAMVQQGSNLIARKAAAPPAKSSKNE